MKMKWISPDGKTEEVIEGADEGEINRRADELDQKWMAQQRADNPSIVVPQEDSTLRDKGRAFAQGGTLGFQDEIQGALGATMDVMGGVEPLENWGAAYRNHRDDERLAQDVYAILHPEENFGLQMAGGMAVPGLGAAKTVFKAPSWARMARTGAGYGAAAGYGTAEGPADAQALQTVAGAGIGAATGLVAPFATQFLAETGKQAAGALSAAMRRVPGAMRGGGPGTRLRGLERLYARMPPGALAGPERERLMRRAAELGIELSPGERTNSLPMRQAEASLRSSPMSPVGWRLNVAREKAGERLNEIVLKAAGAPPGSELSAGIVSRRADELGAIFDRVENQIGRVRIDNEARRQLNDLMNAASRPTNPNRKAMAVIGRLQRSQDFNRQLTGQELKELRTFYQGESTKAWNNSDVNMGRVYDGLVDVLEGIVDRQVARQAGKFTKNQRLPEIWKKARREWAIIKALRAPGSMANGGLSPGAFSNHLKRYDKNYRDMRPMKPGDPRGDLYDALRINEYFGDVVRDSGTATRTAYNGLGNEGLAGLVSRAGVSLASRPLGTAYMRFGSEGMVRPGRTASATMDPLVAAFGSHEGLYGGLFGDEELE